MTNDTMKEIISDAEGLSLDVKDVSMLRYGIKRIAERLQALCDAGLYITPKAALDAVEEELKSSGVEKLRSTGKRSWLELPRGITLKRFVNTKRDTTYIGQYNDTANSGNTNPRRVYQVKVLPLYPGAEIGTEKSKAFDVMVTEDDKVLFTINTNRGRSIAERLGIKGLKAWLGYMVADQRRGKESKKRHRKRNKANRRARKAAEAAAAQNPVNPVNPV